VLLSPIPGVNIYLCKKTVPAGKDQEVPHSDHLQEPGQVEQQPEELARVLELVQLLEKHPVDGPQGQQLQRSLEYPESYQNLLYQNFSASVLRFSLQEITLKMYKDPAFM
jgi:hypothetical protein